MSVVPNGADQPGSGCPWVAPAVGSAAGIVATTQSVTGPVGAEAVCCRGGSCGSGCCCAGCGCCCCCCGACC
ncbi:hypothetical protein D8M35_16315 [Curtobacterium sp. HSID17257]|nr:hypothetical protein D8M35_16315 [Curtobacterium sp. HSID17257]